MNELQTQAMQAAIDIISKVSGIAFVIAISKVIISMALKFATGSRRI